MVEKKVYYCDYCGVRLTPGTKPKQIKSVWSILTFYFSFGMYDSENISIEGDGCKDCFESYEAWVISRGVGGLIW